MDDTRKLQLKIEALKEGFSNRCANYEDTIAEYRVLLTEQAEESQRKDQEVAELLGRVHTLEERLKETDEEEESTNVSA